MDGDAAAGGYGCVSWRLRAAGAGGCRGRRATGAASARTASSSAAVGGGPGSVRASRVGRGSTRAGSGYFRGVGVVEDMVALTFP